MCKPLFFNTRVMILCQYLKREILPRGNWSKGRKQILYNAGLQLIFRNQNWQKNFGVHFNTVIRSTPNAKVVLVRARQDHLSFTSNTESKLWVRQKHKNRKTHTHTLMCALAYSLAKTKYRVGTTFRNKTEAQLSESAQSQSQTKLTWCQLKRAQS